MIKRYISLLFFVFVLVMPAVVSAQCAMCKASVESSANGPNSVASGINKGILYLMAVPYILLVFIFRKQISLAWKQLRAKKRSNSTE